MTRGEQAREYALKASLYVTDTLMQLMERAFLAGMTAQEKHAPAHDGPYLQQSPEPVVDPEWRPVRHSRGQFPCHATAFFVIEKLDSTQKADITKLRTLPDLAPATPMTPAVCGSCEQVIDIYTTRDLDWAPHLEKIAYVESPLYAVGPPAGSAAESLRETYPLVERPPSIPPETAPDRLTRLLEQANEMRKTDGTLRPEATPTPPAGRE